MPTAGKAEGEGKEVRRQGREEEKEKKKKFLGYH
jgi:hypothetical protein